MGDKIAAFLADDTEPIVEQAREPPPAETEVSRRRAASRNEASGAAFLI